MPRKSASSATVATRAIQAQSCHGGKRGCRFYGPGFGVPSRSRLPGSGSRVRVELDVVVVVVVVAVVVVVVVVRMIVIVLAACYCCCCWCWMREKRSYASRPQGQGFRDSGFQFEVQTLQNTGIISREHSRNSEHLSLLLFIKELILTKVALLLSSTRNGFFFPSLNTVPFKYLSPSQADRRILCKGSTLHAVLHRTDFGRDGVKAGPE